MRSLLLAGAMAFLVGDAFSPQAIASDWISAPQPKFPSGALRKGSEGIVKLRVQVTNDGIVTGATVVKSSGDQTLDETARSAVLKWKMKPSAVKPSDVTKGRVEEVEFRQEAMMSASYPLSVNAGFKGERQWKRWTYSPFPYYPMDARRLRHMGTVLLTAKIGADGTVTDVQIVKTSGYNDLDEEAAKAVRHWRAHKQYAGQTFGVPVTFKLGFH